MALIEKRKTLIVDLLFDIVASFILGIGIYCFIEPANIAPGGVSGIALMTKYLWNIPIGFMNVAINIPLVILSFRYLGKRFTIKSLNVLMLSSVILDFIITPYFPQYMGDRMLGTIYGGLFSGLALGIIFARGGTTAGTDIVSYLLELKFPHIPIGQILMGLDCVIIAVSVFVFKDMESALFALIALFCQTVLINEIVYGQEKGTMVFIVSEKNDEIAEQILNEMDRGATILKGQGAYSRADKEVLYCVIRMQEFPTLKKLVYHIDKKAFLAAGEATRVHGEGFKKLTVK